jgi:hypothetical protein
MSHGDAPRVLSLSQSAIRPEICAPLTLLLHHTLACTVRLRSCVEQASWHGTGIDVAQVYALIEAYTDLATERLAVFGAVVPPQTGAPPEARYAGACVCLVASQA